MAGLSSRLGLSSLAGRFRLETTRTHTRTTTDLALGSVLISRTDDRWRRSLPILRILITLPLDGRSSPPKAIWSHPCDRVRSFLLVRQPRIMTMTMSMSMLVQGMLADETRLCLSYLDPRRRASLLGASVLVSKQNASLRKHSQKWKLITPTNDPRRQNILRKSSHGGLHLGIRFEGFGICRRGADGALGNPFELKTTARIFRAARTLAST
ncbi:hypothetical protein B0T26DRAFT_800009 [Lasiosphaeria miniovina]|uniref:Uncharacterized protein n=1 Tax=Lasiosphaeria miniovina TaxID=1954250 RepID=A0AA40B5P7_9PEZI|nr:uncharacterized protein B0T26DRAFT_800009 [Lasiosphaeria miniovina]KAK0728175.1 hypothetical protein B0T26DRAFT_800009 [Lasiosphaeria miniovina]